MNKRILIVCLAIFALGTGAASAFDLNDLMGLDMLIEIDGIEFVVPNGFEEDNNYELVNSTESIGPYEYVMNGKFFGNGSNYIFILVSDYQYFNVTDEVLELTNDQKATYNGIDGYVRQDGDAYVFSYGNGTKMISVSTNDRNLIGDVLIN